MLYPVKVHVVMFAMDHRMMFLPKKSTFRPMSPSSSLSGEKLGLYM